MSSPSQILAQSGLLVWRAGAPRCTNRSLAVLFSVVSFLFVGCGAGVKPKIYAYVSAPQVVLRDRIATVFDKAGMVKNGERVEVLERSRRFVRVRTARNEIGWIEERYLVPQSVFDYFQKLQTDHASDPPQARATTRNEVNLHVMPQRESEHFYQLKDGEKVELLQRAATAKPIPQAVVAKALLANKGAKNERLPPALLEDWWLARDSQHRVGWLLARMVDEDVPLEVAQYAEGQRIVAYFMLNQVQDEGKQLPQYLIATTEPKDGLPFDFDQIRVFTWNTRKHRYETAYRERKLEGVLPIRVGQQAFEKEGTLPTFSIRLKDDSDKIRDVQYKLQGPIVRRVLAPAEQGNPQPHQKPQTKKASARGHR